MQKVNVREGSEQTMSENGPKLSTAISDAQSIIEAAERRASELRAKTEQAYREASEEGYRAGFEEGRSDAVKSAVRLLEDRGIIGDTLNGQVARLALAVAEMIIGEQIEADPALIQKLAVRALQESAVGASATIVVNPLDKPALDGFADELRKVTGGITVAVESESTIARGGCIVRTDFGEVDARIDSLIENIGVRLGVSRRKNGKR